MSFVNVFRHIVVCPVARPSRDVQTAARDRTRASVALAVIWAGLAVAFGAYAIAEGSTGAVAVTVAILAILRVSWMGAWYDDPVPAAVKREISFLP